MQTKVVIGTWPLSGDFGEIPLRQVEATLINCLKNELFEYDTAPNYGRGFMEHCLGKILPTDDRIKINTKVGNSAYDGKSFALDHIARSFQQSLRRLRRDHINVLFLHNPRHDLEQPDEVVQWMQSLKKSGVIKYMGLSAAKGFIYEPSFIEAFDVIQSDANLLYLKEMREYEKFNAVFMARSPLATGILSGKLTSNTVFPNGDHRSAWLTGERLESLVKRCHTLSTISDLSLPSLARRFLLSQPSIQKVIFGVKSVGHVADLITDLDAPMLDADLQRSLIALHDQDFGLHDETHLGF